MLELIVKYLGYKNISDVSNEVKSTIEECISEVKSLSKFKYTYLKFDSLLPFLTSKEYEEYLKNSSSYLLVGTTLGIEIDKRTTYYSNTDMTKCVIFDCCASAYLETIADSYEDEHFKETKSFRFCPGYNGTSLKDNLIIAEKLNAYKEIGVEVLDSYMLVPKKSMFGIIALGKSAKKSCKNCLLLKNCSFRKDGKVCYQN